MQIDITEKSAKAAARYLRQKAGIEAPHSTILHAIAISGGYSSWQAMSAVLRNDDGDQPAPVELIATSGLHYDDLARAAAWSSFSWLASRIWMSRNDEDRHDRWAAQVSNPSGGVLSFEAFLSARIEPGFRAAWDVYEIATILSYFMSEQANRKVAMLPAVVLTQNAIAASLLRLSDMLPLSSILATMEDIFLSKTPPSPRLMIYGGSDDVSRQYRDQPHTIVQGANGEPRVNYELPPVMDIPNIMAGLRQHADAKMGIHIFHNDETGAFGIELSRRQ